MTVDMTVDIGGVSAKRSRSAMCDWQIGTAGRLGYFLTKRLYCSSFWGSASMLLLYPRRLARS